MDSTPTFEPENKIPPRRCERHGLLFRWINEGNRQVFRCDDCYLEGERAKVQASEMPLIRYKQDWGRDRPYTRKEQKHPARKPQF